MCVIGCRSRLVWSFCCSEQNKGVIHIFPEFAQKCSCASPIPCITNPDQVFLAPGFAPDSAEGPGRPPRPPAEQGRGLQRHYLAHHFSPAPAQGVRSRCEPFPRGFPTGGEGKSRVVCVPPPKEKKKKTQPKTRRKNNTQTVFLREKRSPSLSPLPGTGRSPSPPRSAPDRGASPGRSPLSRCRGGGGGRRHDDDTAGTRRDTKADGAGRDPTRDPAPEGGGGEGGAAARIAPRGSAGTPAAHPQPPHTRGLHRVTGPGKGRGGCKRAAVRGPAAHRGPARGGPDPHGTPFSPHPPIPRSRAGHLPPAGGAAAASELLPPLHRNTPGAPRPPGRGAAASSSSSSSSISTFPSRGQGPGPPSRPPSPGVSPGLPVQEPPPGARR